MSDTRTLSRKDWDTVLEIIDQEASALWDLYVDGDIDRKESDNLNRIYVLLREQEDDS